MSKEKTNNDLYKELSIDKQRKVQFMVSRGKKLKDAIAEVSKKPAEAPAADEGGKKESTKDKKARLAKEIEALGGEAPAASASVAKFEEALTAAKAAKESDTDTEETDTEETDTEETDLV